MARRRIYGLACATWRMLGMAGDGRGPRCDGGYMVLTCIITISPPPLYGRDIKDHDVMAASVGGLAG